MESSRIFRGRYRLFIQVSIMTSIITPCRITGKQFQNLLNSGDETLRCDINCSASLRTPLCGSDGRTYDSLCDIERANCEGHPVRLKQPGQCPESKRCLMERLHAQEMAQKPAAGIFIPECHSDGSFSTVQCHAGTGYCWCVNKHGRPIPGSSTRFERPNCAHYSNVNSLKRTARGRRPRRSCGILDRDAFNKNLVQVFGSEFKRVQESNNLSSTSPLELRIITWKFNQLDANDNQVLNKSELRDLRRMVKKIIRPRPCARTFTQYCDLDLNKNITQAEWAVCLGVTLNKDETTQVSALKKTTSGNKAIKTMLPSTTTMPASTSTISEAEFIPQFTRSPKGSRMPSSWKSQFNDFNRAQGGIDFLQEVIPTNKSEKKKMAHKRRPTCGSERSKALTKQRKDPSAWTYVPDCDNSGNYAKVQCHSATRFCWCVNPENGKPISQTSKFNAQPNCNLVSFRPLRGCPAERKEEFLANLTATLAREMAAKPSSNQTSPLKPDSKEEVFKWKFRSLDKNENEILDRAEWRPFKVFMASEEGLSKCGKSYMKYCDSDDNKRVTLNEWSECSKMPSESERRRVPETHKRRGENPLTRYLKD